MAKALFDNGASAEGCVFNFSRNLATYDDLGETVAANTPRYGKPNRIFDPFTGWTDVNDGNAHTVFSTGVDVNGTTPITVLRNDSSGLFDVYVGDFALAVAAGTTPDADGNGIYRTTLGAPAAGNVDLASASNGFTANVNGAGGGDNLYVPKAVRIFYGLIAVLCEVRVNTTGSTYEPYGYALAWSDDYGQTWNLGWDDVDDIGSGWVDTNKSRCREWALTEATPLTRGGTDDILFVSTDYITLGASARFHATRFTRSGSAWTLDNYGLVWSTTTNVTHGHSAVAILNSAGTAFRGILASTGDTAGKAAINWFKISSGSLSNISAITWSQTEISGDRANTLAGRQPVAAVANADLTTVFFGADVAYPAITECAPNAAEDAMLSVRKWGDQASNEYDKPVSNPNWRGYDVFHGGCPKPGVNGLFWMTLNHTDGISNGYNDAYAPRTIVSPDGEVWGQACSALGGDKRCVTQDGYIVNNAAADGSAGLSYGRLPASRVVRPLVVQKGGSNYLFSGATASVNTTGGGSITKITDWAAEQATWEAAGHPFPLPNLPGPGHTYKWVGPLSAAVPMSTGQWCGSSTSVLGTDTPYQVEWWELNIGRNGIGVGWQDRTAGTGVDTPIQAMKNTWTLNWHRRLTSFVNTGTATGALDGWIPFPHNFACTFYWHLSHIEIQGAVSHLPSYPKAMATVSNTPVVGPNEVASLSRLGINGNQWTVAACIHIPFYAHTVENEEEVEWPGLVAYIDANNFIKVTFDPADALVNIAATVGGVAETVQTVATSVFVNDVAWIGLSADGDSLRWSVSCGQHAMVASSFTMTGGAIGAPSSVYLISDESQASITYGEPVGVYADQTPRTSSELKSFMESNGLSLMAGANAPRTRNFRRRCGGYVR